MESTKLDLAARVPDVRTVPLAKLAAARKTDSATAAAATFNSSI